MTNPGEVKQLREFVRRAQDLSWDRLDKAIRNAINGAWSMDCANTCIDIIQAAQLVGVTPWQSVPIDLVLGGVYEAVCQVGGLDADLPDDAEIARTVDLFGRTSSRPRIDVHQLRQQYAPTISSLRSPGETSFIQAEIGAGR